MTKVKIEKPKIKVIVKAPGKEPELKEIGTSLEDYQAEVSGYIESIPFPGEETIDIILNEMGKLNGMDENIIVPEYGDILMGPLVFIGVNADAYQWCSLTDKEINIVLNYIKHNKI